MSFIQNFFTSRDNQTDGNTYVGQEGRLWYNPLTNSIYVNTANIAGGTPVALATGANIVANNLTVNTVTSTSGTVSLVGNITISGNISPAAADKIGGIFPGPGVVISNQGELTIDTANLPLSFGNFTASNNILSITNVNEDMILQTEGNAEIQLIGNIGFYKPDGIPPNVANRFAFFNSDGQVEFRVPTVDLTGAIQIIGSTTGTTITPGLTGAMLHVTGQIDTDCRLYFDGNGGYVAINNRAWNGNILTGIQAIEAGDDVLRLNATAATSSGMGSVAFAQIRYTAIENQTPTAQGSNINFWTTAAGTAASTRVEVANISVANGVSATKFTTTGNIAGGNLNLTANIVADYIVANNVGSAGNVEIESNNTYWYFTTDNRFVGNGNVVVGNVSTTGQVSATANITGGNILTSSLVSARNYNGQARDAGTLGAAGTLTIDFATDNMVLVNLTTTATIAFANITAGKTVSVLVKNSTGQNRAVTLGVAGTNTSGGNPAPNVTDGRTGVFVYRTFNTDVGNVFCEVN